MWLDVASLVVNHSIYIYIYILGNCSVDLYHLPVLAYDGNCVLGSCTM